MMEVALTLRVAHARRAFFGFQACACLRLDGLVHFWRLAPHQRLTNVFSERLPVASRASQNIYESFTKQERLTQAQPEKKDSIDMPVDDPFFQVRLV